MGKVLEVSELYEVRIIDNDYNTYQQVMDISMLALAVSEDEAFAIAWEVDHRRATASWRKALTTRLRL